jgi:hypothetical protein
MRCREADAQESGARAPRPKVLLCLPGLRLLVERLSLFPPLLSSDHRREPSRDRFHDHDHDHDHDDDLEGIDI